MPSHYLCGSSSNSRATTYRQSVCEVDKTLQEVAKILKQINRIEFEKPTPTADHRGPLGDKVPPRLKDARVKDNSRPEPPTGTGRLSGALKQSNGTTNNPPVRRNRGSGTKETDVGTNNPPVRRNRGSGTKETDVGTNNPPARKKRDKQPPQTPRSSGWTTKHMCSSQRISTIKPMTSGEQKRMEQSWMSSKIK